GSEQKLRQNKREDRHPGTGRPQQVLRERPRRDKGQSPTPITEEKSYQRSFLRARASGQDKPAVSNTNTRGKITGRSFARPREPPGQKGGGFPTPGHGLSTKTLSRAL
ncbi:unnamed protein product, partial [Ectocarpus sp. 6 AP-2014]